MSHGKLREDKNCLNCGHYVEERFCPHCGQENVETRQPFHYLFTHFIEDFTHYDGQFWKTIKYLLFFPGKLTKEYLAGKRQQYVPPVKLYIFVSFITFLLIAFSGFNVGSGKNDEPKKEKTVKTEGITKNINAQEIIKLANQDGKLSKEDSLGIVQGLSGINDSGIGANTFQDFIENDKMNKESTFANARNMKEFDSLQTKSHNKFAYILVKPAAKKFFELRDKGVPKKDILSGFLMTFFHSLPKALFLYLPFFAFLLWIFHNKKKWWYFDHGIFTLHYFSFLLLVTFLLMASSAIINRFLDYSFFNILFSIVCISAFIYTILYFFIAHHRVYETRRLMSIFLGVLIFWLNFIGFFVMLTVLVYLSFVMIH